MRYLEIDLRSLLSALDEAEGVVQRGPAAVDAVVRPDDEPRRFEFPRRLDAYLRRAAQLPGQDVHPVGQHHDALVVHAPERARELA